MLKLEAEKKSVVSASITVHSDKFSLKHLSSHKKSAVHDLTQVIAEDCLRVLNKLKLTFFTNK